jgi:hypothetical protein
VEEHLARVNEGHLIRIVGASFELVRGWALTGVPMAIVFRGIEQKAERHRAGRSKRPLRLEFCEGDVRALYEDWRRAVGLGPQATDGGEGVASPAIDERRRPSIPRQLDRAIDRIVRAAGQLEAPESFREALAGILDQLSELRELARHARGEQRRALLERALTIDAAIGAAARGAAGDGLGETVADATRELAGFRTRLTPEVWQKSLDVAVDRLLRERYGLPTLDLAVPE